MLHGKRLIMALAAAAILAGFPAHAQEYPTKPITLIVPWPAGG
jgi:tripartite-type tricarboxylate transporter receptor subunit TctC